MQGRSLTDLRRSVVPAAAACLLVIGVIVLATGAPVAWFLLGLTATLAVAVLVPALRDRRVFEPLPLIAAFVLVYYVVRAFQLMLSRDELYSFFGVSGSVRQLLAINNQEIARFVTERLAEPFEPAMTRAVGAVAVFMAVATLAYHLRLGERIGRPLGRLGRGTDGLNVRAMVLGSLFLGLVGQIAIVAHAGGLRTAADEMLRQQTGQAGLGLFVLATFAPVGMVLWTAWRRPRRRVGWVAYTLAMLEIGAFYALSGSRGAIFDLLLAVAVIWNFVWRRWRTREVIGAAVLFAVLAAALLAVRQGTFHRSFSQAVTDAPSYLTDPRGVLNDNTQFDTLFIATTAIGHGLPHKHGGWALDALRANLPGAIDPGKPPPGDVAFRRSIWGSQYGAGRPVTLVGDFFYDFGFAGIVVGSFLVGILARALLGLVRDGSREGRAFRVALYALALVVLYEALGGTYSLTISQIIRLLVPFAFAILVLGRLPQRLARPISAGGATPGKPPGGT